MSELYNPLLALAEPLPEYRLESAKAVLLLIDMQRAYVDPDCGLLRQARERGLADAFRYYRERVVETVIPNLSRLLEAARAAEMSVMYAKIESLVPDGRDRGIHHRRLGVEVTPGSSEAEIVPQLAPVEGEIVFRKTASGVFNGTNIDFVLRSMGITQLIIGGVVTNGCVETTVRDAADLGYEVILIDDACAAMTKEIQRSSLSVLDKDYAQVRSTQAVVDELINV